MQTWIAEAVLGGARRHEACALLGISGRTLERWRTGPAEDAREGPHEAPPNQLTEAERRVVVATVNSAAFRDLSPNQIVPRLADAGQYLASEATVYRILRGSAAATPGAGEAPGTAPAARACRDPPESGLVLDITYLLTPMRDVFLYVYLVIDIFSRTVVGWAVHDEESADHAACLFQAICRESGLDPTGIVLHADNGGR